MSNTNLRHTHAQHSQLKIHTDNVSIKTNNTLRSTPKPHWWLANNFSPAQEARGLVHHSTRLNRPLPSTIDGHHFHLHHYTSPIKTRLSVSQPYLFPVLSHPATTPNRSLLPNQETESGSDVDPITYQVSRHSWPPKLALSEPESQWPSGSFRIYIYSGWTSSARRHVGWVRMEWDEACYIDWVEKIHGLLHACEYHMWLRLWFRRGHR